jgi:basic membrane lipoprotein Med (substrate-binding protein (PBP1-ABC) superfamily)
MRRSSSERPRAWRGAALAWLLLGAGCTSLVDWGLGAGLGASCSSDEQCQGSSCIDGLCTSICDPEPCPSGSVCASGLCRVPVDATFVLPGPVGQEDLSYSFELARQELATSLGYLTTRLEDDLFLASDAVARADAAIADGSDVVVVARPAHAQAFVELADRHPDVAVFAHGATSSRPNLVGFDVRAYQGTYLAGVAAARKTTTKRLCFIASTVTPSVIARVNGFVLGARTVDAAAVVEVAFLGDWHDTLPPVNGQTRERTLTLEMMGRGCDVVAHALDNNIPVGTVGQTAMPGVFVIAANVEDACTLAPGRCIGSLVYRWSPILEELVEQAARGSLDGGLRLYGIRTSDADSPMSFRVPSNLIGAQSIAAELDALRGVLASEDGVGSVFDGPIRSTGQCEEAIGSEPCVPEGERLSAAGLASMCWLVEGAVTYDASSGADVPALVPKEGDCAGGP